MSKKPSGGSQYASAESISTVLDPEKRIKKDKSRALEPRLQQSSSSHKDEEHSHHASIDSGEKSDKRRLDRERMNELGLASPKAHKKRGTATILQASAPPTSQPSTPTKRDGEKKRSSEGSKKLSPESLNMSLGTERKKSDRKSPRNPENLEKYTGDPVRPQGELAYVFPPPLLQVNAPSLGHLVSLAFPIHFQAVAAAALHTPAHLVVPHV